MEDCVWACLSDYFKKYGLASHQKESFNHFVHTSFPHIISENSDVTTQKSDGSFSWHIQFCNPCLMRPTVKEADGFEKPILPHTARLRGLSYTSTVTVDVVHDKVSKDGKLVWRRVYREVVLCRIPIMVQSSACYLSDPSERRDECVFDEGGYFIINGHEKCLLAQEKLRTNHAFVFPSKNNPKLQYTCEVRSCHELKMRSTSTLLLSTTRPVGGGLPDIQVQLPFLERTLTLPCIFKVLGVTDNEEALTYMHGLDGEAMVILKSVFDSDVNKGQTSEEMFDLIGVSATRESTQERRRKYTEHILSNELLPHMGLVYDANCNRRKLHYIGHMVRRLLLVHTGEESADDRDSYVNKRVDGAGTLLSLLLRQLYRNHLKTVSVLQARLVESGKIDRVSLGDLLADKRITSGLKYAFATGHWGITKSGISAQNGVAQVVSRMTALSAKSNLRRISTPLAREGQAPAPRLLHASSWGLICPSETPEGGSCGLVKNLSLMCSIRHGTFSTPMCQLILRVIDPSPTPLLLATESQKRDGVTVHVNGVIIGVMDDSDSALLLATRLREGRRKNWIPRDTSVTVKHKTLLVATDPGSLCRPLLVRSELHRLEGVVSCSAPYENRWDLLLQEGIVEYLDKDEELSNAKVAVSHSQALSSPSFTHAEIDPCLILGVCSSLIVFPDHNQSPRNTYQAAMGKQAVSVFSTRWMIRMDTISHVLCYPSRPLVATKAEEKLGGQLVPSGCVLMVAILCYSGFNQEDSVIVSKGAIDRGALRSTVFRSYKDEEKAGSADAEKFCNPETSSCAGLRRGCYSKIDESGIVSPGTTVHPGDVIIGKCMSTADVALEKNESRPVVKRDRSTIHRYNESCTVDSIFQSRSRDGNRTIKVRTRCTRIPVIGDKVSSRHGQKGVIGDILPEEDMPFCPRTGMRPDLIVNPHAIPSRMTVGQLVEALLGTAACAEGKRGDGTPFRGLSIESIADELERNGMQRYGNRTLYNGQTGEAMPCLVFLAPTFYQRLKHMVVDKYHARSRGATQILTRQPLEGRSREGGLRFGEMEKDCLISHGASSVLSERLFYSSDPFKAPLCRECGILAQPGSKKTSIRNADPVCKACGSKSVIEKDMPFATKLLLQELMAMNIAPRVRMT